MAKKKEVKEKLYGAGKYRCKTKCFSGRKLYEEGDILELKEETVDPFLQHFTLVKKKSAEEGLKEDSGLPEGNQGILD